MEWSKTTTIFIIAFLILDIFLAVEYFKKKDESPDNIVKMTRQQEMEADGIKNFKRLPTTVEKGSYITAKRKSFSLEEIRSLMNQEPLTQINESTEDNPVNELNMGLTVPYQLTEADLESRANEFVSKQVLNGNDYKFWNIDKANRQINYYQTYRGRTIFEGESTGANMGKITIYYNDKNEVTSYTQSMLTDIKELENPQPMISASDAVNVLYSQGRLVKNSEIVESELGYYTQYPLPTFRNLAPAWRIEIKRTEAEEKEVYEEFMVHAIDGEIIKGDQKQTENE